MIPIARPLLGEEEKSAVLGVLSSGMLAQGKKVAEFEQRFAEFIGVQHAIATSNGTTALHAALLAHNVGLGDEVITTPFSFIATANAIKMTGATPVFVDINEKTFNINPDLIEKAITSKTKAILPVHLFGLPADTEKISAIAKKHHLAVIEDACQAHGAEVAGKKVGSFGTGCFSFYATKNMTTGEGGMITTNDDAVAQQCGKLISHGSERKYYHDFIGYNYRMTDIAAAIGIEQLKKLPLFNAKRKGNAQFLAQYLQHIQGIVVPEMAVVPEINPASNLTHVFHQYTIRVTPEFPFSRDQLLQNLTENNIGTAIFYPVPIHQQKAYPEYHHLRFPVAEMAAAQVLSLPVHPGVSEEDLLFITRFIQDVEHKSRKLL
ncbi:DegT/DnrJ/EryC1/StrS family aminotransferase [Candidatus Woesearchaeota archaeon]|nr:DegT/DnrJ/EryC1/StrS family aminotransferase [Candidatus Woesearchaeota archaeon]